MKSRRTRQESTHGMPRGTTRRATTRATLRRTGWLALLLILFLVFAGPAWAGDGARGGSSWKLRIGLPQPADPTDPGPDPIPCLPCAPQPTGDGFTLDTSENPRNASPPALIALFLKVGEQVHALDGGQDTRKLSAYASGEISMLVFADPEGVTTGSAPLALRFHIQGTGGQTYVQDVPIG